MIRKAFHYLFLFVFILSACGKSPVSQNPSKNQLVSGKTPTSLTTKVQKETPLPEITDSIVDSPLQVRLNEDIDLTNFHPMGEFSVDFNKHMNPKSTHEAIITYPYVQGNISWADDYQSLAFSPAQGFIPGETYWVYLSRDLLSETGEAFTTARKWEIEIQDAPTIISHHPTQTQLQDNRPIIRITFDREMDTKSVAASLNITPSMPIHLEWDKTTVSIKFTQPLTPGKQYNINLDSSARDSNGIPLSRSYSWNYWLDNFKLAISTTPPHNEKNVRLAFNYPINIEKTGFPFIISPSLPGEWKWLDNKTAQLTTEKTIPKGVQYTLKFNNSIYALNGDMLPLPEDLINFSASPPIYRVDPADGQAADSEFLVKVFFDQPMDHASVEDAFHFEPEMKGEFNWDRNTLIFHPETLLNQNQLFVATIDTTALNEAGQAVFADPYTWSFYSPYGFMEGVFFSEYGSNIQVVDANGRRALQFGINTDLPARVTCNLFQYELMDYVKLYSLYHRDDYYTVRTSIDTGQTELFYSWQVIYDSGGLQELTIPADVPPGLYILNINLHGTLHDQLFLILTANTILIKEFKDELLVWVSDINGSNLDDSEVRLYSDQGEKIRVGKTDGNGLYHTTIPEGYTPLLVAVQGEGGDFTIAGLSNLWNSRYYYGWWWGARQNVAKEYNAYIYTDRPIYKPGQIVYYKVILRHDDDVKYTLPLQDTPIIIQVKDAQNNIVQSKDIYLNDFGSTSGEFSISEGAMLGDYYITVNIKNDYFQQKFKVQDYRKPDYQVTVTSDKKDFIAGEELKLNINVKYLFGKPVKNATLTAKKYQLVSYYGWCDVMDCGNDTEYYWYESGTGPTAEADDNGNYEMSIPVSFGEDYSRYTSSQSSQSYSLWAIEVIAINESYQAVSSYLIYKVYDSREVISLDTKGFMKFPGESFNLNVSARTLLGEPLSEKPLTLEFDRLNEVTWEYEPVMDAIDIKTNINGTLELPLTVYKTGYYMLRLSGKDNRQHYIQHTRWIYVQSSDSPWTRTTQEDINIIADKDSYKPYQKAHFMIESSFSGAGLLTFERGSVNRAIPVNLTAPLTLVDVDIIPEDAPNIYVTINAWEAQDTHLPDEDEYYSSTNIPDSRLRTATVELQVDPGFKALNVQIIPDKEIYQPRQEAKITLAVTDELGEPVSAEVSLAMVDESIYGLSNDLTQPIFQAFYGRRPNSVDTYDSMAPYREVSYLGRGGGGGDDMGSGPRSSFPDTAFWLPAIQTDDTGRAIVVIHIPDTLTSWRLTARAVTMTTRVGESKINILTQQEIGIRPQVPARMVSGDQMHLSALIHNYGEEKRLVEVTLQSTALDITSSLSKTIDLQPGEVLPVEWSVVAADPGMAEIIITAEHERVIVDSISLPLEIMPLSINNIDSQVGSFLGEQDTTIVYPSDALPSSNIQITISRSMAGNILFGLDYLTGYPYGCVEQTMSRALPNAVVGRALSQLGLDNQKLLANLPILIDDGLQRLYGFQHLDGGWGWWFDDLTNDYQTAWVVFGLSITDQAGYPVDKRVIERGAKWLTENLYQMDIRTRAFALYSINLAGYSNKNAEMELFSEAFALDPFSQSVLALSLYRSDEMDKASQILDQITEMAQVHNDQAFWLASDGDGEYHQKTMASSIRSTAMVLEALTQIEPSHLLIPKIVKYLAEKRQANGWGSTNETAFTVIALTDYLTSIEADQSMVSYNIELNGSKILSGSLDQGQPTAKLAINGRQLKPDINHLKITHDGSKPLYYSITSNMYISKPNLEPKGKIMVTRSYSDFQGNTSKAIEAGAIVKIRLTVTLSQPGSFIILEDHLPSGLEAINEKLNTATHDAYALASEYQIEYFWEEYGYNYKEIHPDRVSFFIAELKTGTYTYEYLARATIEGTYVALPAEIYAMYDQELWGISSSRIFTVISP